MNEPMIVPGGPLVPDDLRALEIEATSFGIRNVATLVDRWVDGSQRFDRPGEQFLAALDPGRRQVIGVGALSWCPHVPDALRVRRFYVSDAARRQGVARRLAEQLLHDGLTHSRVFTCNAAASEAAPPFWESLGFERVDVDGITHQRIDQPPT